MVLLVHGSISIAFVTDFPHGRNHHAWAFNTRGHSAHSSTCCFNMPRRAVPGTATATTVIITHLMHD
jgi:hypothetical protein